MLVPRETSAHVVKAEIEVELGMTLNGNTIRNRAPEAGLFGRVSTKETIGQQGESRQTAEICKRYVEKADRILRNSNMV